MSHCIDLRRALHRHPEAGFTEFFSTSLAATELSRQGWTLHLGQELYETARLGVPEQPVLEAALERARAAGADPVHLERMAGGYTGLIATMQRETGPTVTLRFDLDCVEVQEDLDVPWKSLTPGLMHACGHDGHTAVGIELARRLSELPWTGRVNLVFQPAEEGVRGGSIFSQSSLLQGTDYFLSGHLGITNDAEDTLYSTVSHSMNTSKWDLTIKGESVHAALYPRQGINALLAAADLVVELYRLPDNDQTQLNVGTLTAGTGRNVVAGEAKLRAETRGSSRESHDRLNQAFGETCREMERRHGVRISQTLAGEAIYSPPHPELCALAAGQAEAAGLRSESKPYPMMGSEDAFYFIDRVHREGGQGAYFIFGTAIRAPHHNPMFDFNEAILEKMVSFYTALTRELLSAPRR